MDYQETMYTAIEKFSSHIADAETTQEMQQVFFDAHADVEKLRHAASQLPGNETACAAGCVYCCYYTVSLRAHEIVQILEHIRAHFTATEIKEILIQASLNRKLMKKLTHDQIEHTNIRCPLLSKEGLCRCYEVRPLNCRRNNSRNVDLCRQFHDNPLADLSSDSARDIDQMTGIIGYALSEGFSQNGYDDSMYYLTLGLYDGLKKPRSIQRWHQHKKAFSRSAESKEYD